MKYKLCSLGQSVLHAVLPQRRFCPVCVLFGVIIAFCFVMGCRTSGSNSTGTNPSWRRASAEQFQPPKLIGPGAVYYNQAVTENDTAESIAMQKELAKLAASEGWEPPQHDARLSRALAELAKTVPPSGETSYEVIEFFLHRHGIIEPSPDLVILWGDVSSSSRRIKELVSHPPSTDQQGRWHRFGMGWDMRYRKGRRAGQGIAILGVQPSGITLSPFPRRVNLGDSHKLTGKISDNYHSPQIFLSPDNGNVKKLHLRKTSRKKNKFSIPFVCEPQWERVRIEVTAEDSRGPTVLANFPVYCNRDPPVQLPKTGQEKKNWTTAEEVEKDLLRRINVDRKELGLPSLVWHPQAASVARRHSQEMHMTGVVAHTSPTSGTAQDRVRSAGIVSGLVLENVAKAYSPREVHRGLMNSPGHRMNILSKRATHVGIGVALGQQKGSGASNGDLFVSQVFLRKSKKRDRNELQKEARVHIQSKVNAVEDIELSRVAERYAQELATGASPRSVGRRTQKALRSFASRYKTIAVVSTAVVDVEDIPVFDIFKQKNARYQFGLGIAEGRHKDLGNAIFMVVLVARDAASGQ